MIDISCLVFKNVYNDRKWNYVARYWLEVSLYVCIQIVHWLIPSDVIIMSQYSVEVVAHGQVVWFGGTPNMT